MPGPTHFSGGWLGIGIGRIRGVDFGARNRMVTITAVGRGAVMAQATENAHTYAEHEQDACQPAPILPPQVCLMHASMGWILPTIVSNATTKEFSTKLLGRVAESPFRPYFAERLMMD